MIEYTPLSPSEIQELRWKAEHNKLTPEDTMRFIESTRAAFISRPQKTASTASKKPKAPPTEDVDFF